MIINLLKKDFLLVKKYLLFLFIFAVVAPIFITVQIGMNNGGFLGFFITVILLEYILFNHLSGIEDKYKGSALLCATPYTRDIFIKAKYLFFLVIFMIVYFMYTIVSFVVPLSLERLSMFSFGMTLLFITLFFGTIIPLQYKYGFEKTKYISFFIVFLTPFVLPSIVKWFQSKNISFEFAQTLPPIVENVLPISIALLLGFISMTLSAKIYAKKSL